MVTLSIDHPRTTTALGEARPSFAAVKARQQDAWSAGDYAVIGTTLQIVGETLCETVDLHAGSSVLDVAAGNGNATLAAARRGALVTSTDYVPSLLDAGRRRAEAEGLAVDFQPADAEALPFADHSFDVVLSTFGVMFTPDQHQAAKELARVTVPGGRIGLASWTPDSFVGQLFRIIGTYLPPAPGTASPALWGTRRRLAELFDGTAGAMWTHLRTFHFRYQSPQHWLEVFRTYYGPMNKAFAALGSQVQSALVADLLDLAARSNRSSRGSLIVPSEYLEVVIETKR